MLSEDKLIEITKTVMLELRNWRLSDNEKLTLLGLNVKPRVLPQFAKGEKALPDDSNALERARHILGIARALRGFFPLNHQGGSIWLRSTSKYFTDKPPIAYMLEDGLQGMHKVWANLDCTQGWD